MPSAAAADVGDGPVVAVIRAAGSLPWRRRRGRLQVAVVHRPRYDDWAWAKGKLDRNESWPGAAVRETYEETGLRVHLGRPLPSAHYPVSGPTGRRTQKEVRYWAAEVVGGNGRLINEIDEVAWLDVGEAAGQLSYPRDRDQLEALTTIAESAALTTWPLALVRHAKARPRQSWRGADPQRPLDARGHAQARRLVPLLAAYGVTRLVSSPSARCADTLAPFGEAIGSRLRLKPGLSEEGYAADPAKSVHHLHRLLERGTASAVCSHGPVLPDLLDVLAGLVDPDSPDAEDATALLKGAAAGMDKGEVIVAHLVGTGEEARVVAAERHDVPG